MKLLSYIDFGWDINDFWSIEKKARLIIPKKQFSDEKKLIIQFQAFLPKDYCLKQIFKVVVNGSFYDEFTVNTSSLTSITIDLLHIEEFNIVDFEFLNPISPKFCNISEDNRELAIRINNISFERKFLAKGYCAIPWFMCNYNKDGTISLCPRNPEVVSDFSDSDSDFDYWNSPKLVNVRENIRNGYSYNHYCEKCYNDNGAMSYARFYNILQYFSDQFYSSRNTKMVGFLLKFFARSLMKKENKLDVYSSTKVLKKKYKRIKWFLDRRISPNSFIKFNNFFIDKFIMLFQFLTKSDYWRSIYFDDEISVSSEQLYSLFESIDLYLDGEKILKKTPLFSNVNLVNFCNARCITCLGYHNEQIYNDLLQMPLNLLKKTYKNGETLQFFMNGSELLLYKHWKFFVDELEKCNVLVDISTNAILFSPENNDFILSKNNIKFIGLSIDSSKKETFEKIRLNIDYDRMIKNIRDLLEKVLLSNWQGEILFSFVYCQENKNELVDFIDFCDSLRTFGERKLTNVTVSYRKLEYYDNEKYLNWYKGSFWDPDKKLINEIKKVSKEYDLPVRFRDLS